MSWARMLLMGNVGQQLDIEDVEGEVASLRSRMASQRDTDESQDQALLTLRRELTQLTLVVGELTRLLVAGGAVPAEAVERIVHALERPKSG